MAEAERILAALGAVPKGARPKTILAGDENQEPGYYQTDPLSNLVRTLKKRQLDIEDATKKKQEAAAKKADMYKTLREAGYDPKSAYDAVIKSTLTPPGPEDTSLKKTTREKILAKLAKGETLSTGEQQVYDDTIKHKTTDENILDEAISGNTVETATQKKTREDILDKIARGTPLTPGEQKIYDEVIKKKPAAAPQETLETVLGNQKEKMIPVTAPDGTKGSVPESKLAAALAAGYKKR